MKLDSRLGCKIADIDALGEDARAELIDGTMYRLPSKTRLQARIAGILVMDLVPAYQDGVEEWWIRTETQIGPSSKDLVVVEAAGWKRDRDIKPKKHRTKYVPDWACDVVTQSTSKHVMTKKRATYARLGVKYWWLIDPEQRTLTVRKLKEGAWVKIGTYEGNVMVQASPFKTVEIDLAQWWKSDACKASVPKTRTKPEAAHGEKPIAPTRKGHAPTVTPKPETGLTIASEPKPAKRVEPAPAVPCQRSEPSIPKKAPEAISTRISEILKIACAYEWRVARIPAAVAGWLKARTEPAPYWICSIVMDPQGEKRDVEARKAPGAQWWWTIDLRTRTLEVRHRQQGQWELVQSYVGGVETCVQPFDKVRFKLVEWWALAGLDADDRMVVGDGRGLSGDQALELVERAVRGGSGTGRGMIAEA